MRVSTTQSYEKQKGNADITFVKVIFWKSPKIWKKICKSFKEKSEVVVSILKLCTVPVYIQSSEVLRLTKNTTYTYSK